MTPDGDGGGTAPEPDPALDPDVLEELEFWIGPEDDDEPPASSRSHSAGHGATTAPDPGVARDGGTAAPPGAVVLVGTPIGNLGDLSPRAVDNLRGADVIYCEDTRHSRKLLTHAGVTGVPLRSLHEHNEGNRIEEVLAAVGDGRTVAVVSDAGMPGISDPGARLVAAAAEAGVTVTVVPGPSAVLAALVASGLPVDRFCFEGFLPRSGRDRRERLEALAGETRTTVLFEAPGRVAGTLADLMEHCGASRPVVIARELTKLHEEIWRGPLAEAATWTRGHTLRGEVVLVLAGAPPTEAEPVGDAELTAALEEGLARGERTRGLVDDVAGLFGVPRRRVYELALAVRRPPSPDRPDSSPMADG
jgi:16S rRNA (cytidine1402-2'-O)-methyltransferase